MCVCVLVVARLTVLNTQLFLIFSFLPCLIDLCEGRVKSAFVGACLECEKVLATQVACCCDQTAHSLLVEKRAV